MEATRQREESKRETLWIPAMLVGLGLALLPGSGSAQTLSPVDPGDGCGQTLSAAGEYVLTGDLVCSGAVSGVIIAGSDVVLHLAGHTISNTTCDLDHTFAGVFVEGGTSGVRIDGGTVTGFNDGIVLSSSRSRVKGVTVKGACVFGIVGQGQDNWIERNVVTASGSDGIILDLTSGSHVHANDSSANGRAGVAISEFSDGNFVEDNILDDNGGTEGYGVFIANGNDNHIRGNVIKNSRNGISIESPRNDAQYNLVSGSTNAGIAIGTVGAPSTVLGNTVLGSGVTDMSDASAACAGNTWSGNTFQTDQVAGVSDGGPGVGCL